VGVQWKLPVGGAGAVDEAQRGCADLREVTGGGDQAGVRARSGAGGGLHGMMHLRTVRVAPVVTAGATGAARVSHPPMSGVKAGGSGAVVGSPSLAVGKGGGGVRAQQGGPTEACCEGAEGGGTSVE